jgi:hypothetical protein
MKTPIFLLTFEYECRSGLGELRHNVDSLDSCAHHRRWQLRPRLPLRAVALRRQRRRNKCPKTVCSFVALLKSERKIRRAIC